MTNTKQTLFGFIEGIKNKYKDKDKEKEKEKEQCTNYKDLTYSDTDFVFKPLDIKGANGFIVYSLNKIVEDKWFATEEQKQKQAKKIEELGTNCENYACRYYYYEKLDNKGEHVTIVMINPAFAYSKKLDSTINNVRNNILNEKILNVGSFDIVNISPIRTPYTDALAKLEKPELEKSELYNKKEYVGFLKSVLGNSNKFILAWGNSIDKISDKSKIMQLLGDEVIKEKLYALALTKKGNPMHLCSMNNTKLECKEFQVCFDDNNENKTFKKMHNASS